jgi:hypothetical protein
MSQFCNSICIDYSYSCYQLASSADKKNAWNRPSTLSYVFLPWLLFGHGHNVTSVIAGLHRLQTYVTCPII